MDPLNKEEEEELENSLQSIQRLYMKVNKKKGVCKFLHESYTADL